MKKYLLDIDMRQSRRDMLRPNKFAVDDTFVLRDGKTHPFAVICPGGGYAKVCSFIEGTPFAHQLNALGISAFIVYYRCKKKAAFPAPMDDLAKAVDFIFKNAARYHLDTSSYSVWGSSAGGHLAASFGTESIGWKQYALPKPQAIVLAYPVVSMKAQITHAGTRRFLIGANANNDIVHLTSIEEQITAAYPPTYVWCGKDDKTVPPVNSERLVAALKEQGVPYSFTLYESAPHGIGPGTGTQAEGWIEKAVRFWLEEEKA